jgi:hypothetical protein
MTGKYNFLFGVLLASVVISGCEEKKAAQTKIEPEPKTQAIAQETVSRRELMFDKSPNPDLLPVELIPFVSSPYVAYDFVEADLNRDGLDDYILVLVQPSTKVENGEDDLNEPAPALIILRQKDKTLRYHSSNDKFFTLEDLTSQGLSESGIYADTLGNGFNIYFNSHGAGATASYTNDTYRFMFDAKANKFYLAERTEETGYVSPAAAKGFMLEEARQVTDGSENHYDTIQIKAADYEPTISSAKYKAGEMWFSNFKFAELEKL